MVRLVTITCCALLRACAYVYSQPYRKFSQLSDSLFFPDIKNSVGTWQLLRSKEAIIIIVWYAVISLWLQGNGLTPINLFVFGNSGQYGNWAYAICIASFYPLIGLLADMWIGRHKLVTFQMPYHHGRISSLQGLIIDV